MDVLHSEVFSCFVSATAFQSEKLPATLTDLEAGFFQTNGVETLFSANSLLTSLNFTLVGDSSFHLYNKYLTLNLATFFQKRTI